LSGKLDLVALIRKSARTCEKVAGTWVFLASRFATGKDKNLFNSAIKHN
jgi:hypothetical protein